MNRYQLPKASIVQRYSDANIEVLNTAQLGQISIQFTDKDTIPYTITTQRGSSYSGIWAYRWYQFQ